MNLRQLAKRDLKRETASGLFFTLGRVRDGSLR